MSSCDSKIIAVIGSGLIGRSWAMVFTSGGFRVKIYDSQPGQAASALQEIGRRLQELEAAGTLRGAEPAERQRQMISCHDNLAEALEGAVFVQECVFEQLEVKRGVFSEVERLVGSHVVLSSSTSCLVPSAVFAAVRDRGRCLVAHPVNPPYLVRLVELVPHPETRGDVMQEAHALMTQCGQAPVLLKKEIDGFALNRVQAAIIAESWRLVQDGVISVKDIDLVMSEGLGMRYAFIGPLETVHLNAPEGVEDYMKRYGEGIQRVLGSFGPIPDFTGEPAKAIVEETCLLIPKDPASLSARRERRDHLLMKLSNLKMQDQGGERAGGAGERPGRANSPS